MKVPPGTKEADEAVRNMKTLLNRLKKGLDMQKEAVAKGDVVNARKIQALWFKLASELFTNAEIMTLIYQQHLTGNSVVVRANGSLEKVEDIMNMDPEDMNAFSLYSIMKLHEIFGDDYKNILEIVDEGNPIN